MFYCGRMYVSLQQDVYFIIVGHINSTHKVSLICRLRELSCSWRKLNSSFACGKQISDRLLFINIYNNVYAFVFLLFMFLLFMFYNRFINQLVSISRFRN